MLVFLLTVWAALFAARGTRSGEAMHRMLVERPASFLSGITRGQWLLTGLVVVMLLGFVFVLDAEARVIASMGLPELLPALAMIDLSVLLDLVVVTVLTATTMRLRNVRMWITHRLAPRRPRSRTVRVRRERPPANDDEDRPGLRPAVAFAA